MDTRTGEIYTPEQFKKMLEVINDPERQFFIPMKTPPTEEQMARKPPKVAYNEPCPCGSGKIFRKCCFSLTKRRI